MVLSLSRYIGHMIISSCYLNSDRQNRFDLYNSRNLLRIASSPEDRNKRTQVGSGVIANYFATEFPYTKHLMETLNIDLVHHNVSTSLRSPFRCAFECLMLIVLCYIELSFHLDKQA